MRPTIFLAAAAAAVLGLATPGIAQQPCAATFAPLDGFRYASDRAYWDMREACAPADPESLCLSDIPRWRTICLEMRAADQCRREHSSCVNRSPTLGPAEKAACVREVFAHFERDYGACRRKYRANSPEMQERLVDCGAETKACARARDAYLAAFQATERAYQAHWACQFAPTCSDIPGLAQRNGR